MPEGVEEGENDLEKERTQNLNLKHKGVEIKN